MVNRNSTIFTDFALIGNQKVRTRRECLLSTSTKPYPRIAKMQLWLEIFENCYCICFWYRIQRATVLNSSSNIPPQKKSTTKIGDITTPKNFSLLFFLYCIFSSIRARLPVLELNVDLCRRRRGKLTQR